MTRLVQLARRRATAALAGQVTQALAGLALQVVAARALGAGGLATFSLVYGAIVLATAVCSGLVGDSLTVLDRTDPPVRAGLQVWGAAVSLAAGVLGSLVGVLSDRVPVWAGLLLGVATAAFVVEDTLRRLLMAAGRFGALPAVDLTSLVLSLSTLGVATLAGGPGLADFVVALAVGQAGAAVVAWVLLPAAERPSGPWRSPALGAVFSFGVWRAAAQTIRPALLTVVRLLAIAGVGAAAYGPVEAARVYTAPTLVLVAGIGTFLLPHFAGSVSRGVRAGLRTADRAALGLAAAVAVIGVVAVALLPLLGTLISGETYDVPLVAVAGWSAYAVSSALLLPYASLASVLRHQRRVLALRGLEGVSLVLVALLVTVVDGGVPWAPLALAVGPVLAALAVRGTVLAPLARAGAPGPGPTGGRTPAEATHPTG